MPDHGMFDGERFDLIAHVRALALSDAERAAVRDVLAEYVEKMDAALNRRHDRLMALQRAAESMPTPPRRIDVPMTPGQEDVLRAVIAAAPACRAVERMNLEYAARVLGLLPPEEAEKLSRSIGSAVAQAKKDRSYHRLGSRVRSMIERLSDMEASRLRLELSAREYRGAGLAGNVTRLFENVQPLTGDQRERLEQIRIEHERETLENEKLRPESSPDGPTLLRVRVPGGNISLSNDSHFLAWDMEESRQRRAEFERRRDAIEQRFVDQIRAILTLEQRAVVAGI
jgi:hypothetical protein